uniref:Protein OSB4, chloroplastic n=1 Tax=Noccaea caerulescens TaxID=107243 RepID=A0A1J3FW94_NOCCA
MQFLARRVSKSIRPLQSSRAKQAWVLFQRSSSHTLGGSRAEKSESVIPAKSSSEWPRPTEIPYQPKISNSAELIGYVNQPIQFHAKPDGNFRAGTVITHRPPSHSESEWDSDSTRKFWVPVIFEGDLAHTANCHLKKNDRVYITGQIFVDVSEISGAKPDQSYVHVMVRDLHYVKDSKSLPKFLPKSDGVLKHSASLNKRRDFGTARWFDLLDKPEEWRDYRESKQNGLVHPRHPDFRKKDGSVALWLSDAPDEISSNLEELNFDIPVRSIYAKQLKGGEEEAWKDLVEDMDKWWDNRLNKRYPKAPDFKHKETGVGLWLHNSPSWVVERLPPPKSKTSESH